MRGFMRKFGCFLIIFFLLPCIITVFVKGGEVLEWNKDSVESVKTEDGVTLRWEDYFLGLLAANVLEESEPEMLKAQAVVLRTQACVKLQAGEKLDASYLTIDDLKEKWDAKAFERYMGKYEQAIRDTKREVLCYQKQVAYTPFCRLTNGMTRDGGEVLGMDESGASLYPYLISVDCHADKEAKDEMQIQTFTYKEVQEMCKSFLKAVEKKNANQTYEYKDFHIEETDSSGYVMQVKIGDSVYAGEELRKALNLPSSSFTLQDYKGKLRITTMGCGHGLGMSQNTANEMAKKGKSYEEILSYFFPKTEIEKKNEIFLKLE